MVLFVPESSSAFLVFSVRVDQTRRLDRKLVIFERAVFGWGCVVRVKVELGTIRSCAYSPRLVLACYTAEILLNRNKVFPYFSCLLYPNLSIKVSFSSMIVMEKRVAEIEQLHTQQSCA